MHKWACIKTCIGEKQNIFHKDSNFSCNIYSMNQKTSTRPTTISSIIFP